MIREKDVFPRNEPNVLSSQEFERSVLKVLKNVSVYCGETERRRKRGRQRQVRKKEERERER